MNPNARYTRYSPLRFLARIGADSKNSFFITAARLSTLALTTLTLTILGSAGGAAAAERPVSLTQEPLVMRLSKDEFRIAFGITTEGASRGCNGSIHYQVAWKAEDGITRTDNRLVSYVISPLANRTITVDRQYFDTAEGEHTTDIVKVRVDSMACIDAGDPKTPEIASAMPSDSTP
jgi:hypothetical protein